MTATDLIDLFAADLRERSCTQATIEGYIKNLHRADRELPLGLDTANAEELKAWLWRSGLQPASRATYYSALASFFVWAVESHHLSRNPMRLLKRPKVPTGLARVAADEQARWAIHHTPDPLKLWAILASYAGLRCLEISRLHREHVTEHVISLHRGKGDKPRTVPTHPIAWAAVRDLPAGPITDLTPKQISTRFLQYCLRHGLREMSMHRLRGWHATSSYEATHDLLAVGRNLGHSRPDTTARYIKLNDSQIRAVIDGLPRFA